MDTEVEAVDGAEDEISSGTVEGRWHLVELHPRLNVAILQSMLQAVNRGRR